MNPAMYAGIVAAMEKVAQGWTPPPGSRIKPGTVKAVARMKTESTNVTHLSGGLADAATKVTRRAPKPVIKQLSGKSPGSIGGFGKMMKSAPKPGAMSGDRLRSALAKAKANPGGKMHQLLAARAKLKAS